MAYVLAGIAIAMSALALLVAYTNTHTIKSIMETIDVIAEIIMKGVK